MQDSLVDRVVVASANWVNFDIRMDRGSQKGPRQTLVPCHPVLLLLKRIKPYLRGAQNVVYAESILNTIGAAKNKRDVDPIPSSKDLGVLL